MIHAGKCYIREVARKHSFGPLARIKMNRILLNLLLIFSVNIVSAQLPECAKQKCDSILKAELGENIYTRCVIYIGYECTQKLDTRMDNPCGAESRHSYRVRYKFNFPNQENATFNLEFYCAGYYGKMHVQSENFTRKNQSDLPKDFRDKGLEILDFEIIKKKAKKENPKVNGDGDLALDRDRIYWVFSGREPYINPKGIGDEAMMVHTVTVDPYTGDIISSSSRRH